MFRRKREQKPRGLAHERAAGLKALARGDSRAAASALQVYLEAHPADTRARLNLGVAYYQLGNYGQALEEFRQVAAADPDLPEAWLNLAAAANQLGLLALAGEALQRTTALSPNLPGLHYNLAVLRYKQGRIAEALAEAETELALNPRHKPAQELVRELEARLLARGE